MEIAYGDCYSGLDVQTAPRRLGEFGQLSIRGYEKLWCSGNALPGMDYLSQKKFGQREISFHHLVTRGFT
jgi:hypothetical protein